jgi:mRNA-degrading endonuclease RelE of RelBE toxin-antitoxin system
LDPLNTPSANNEALGGLTFRSDGTLWAVLGDGPSTLVRKRSCVQSPQVMEPSVACDHNLDYSLEVHRVVFAPAALRQYKRLPAAARSLRKKEIKDQLVLQNPTEETRNRLRLRRVSPHADFELRVEPWRVFYRVQDEVVIVELIGRKKGNVLLINGKEFEL